MEPMDITSLWESYNKKLDTGLRLHQQNAEDITKLKAQSFLASMKPIKIFTLVCGLLWVVFVDALIVLLFPVAGPFFLLSAGIQVLLTKLAVGVYVYQMWLIYSVNINEPTLALQEKIARLETSTLWITRVLFLQFPVWTTFYLTENIWVNAPWYFWVLQTAITLGSIYLSGWFFVNIHPKNRHKKWFRLIFEGKEWTPLLKAMELLDELEEEKAHP
eukprot:gene4568-5840_t